MKPEPNRVAVRSHRARATTRARENPQRRSRCGDAAQRRLIAAMIGWLVLTLLPHHKLFTSPWDHQHGRFLYDTVAAWCALSVTWATALIVLGPEEGFELARREELAAYFMIRNDEGGLATRTTPSFEALFGGNGS